MYCHDLFQDVTVLKNAKNRSESLQTLASQQYNAPCNFSCRLRMPQSYKAPQIQRLSTDSRALCEKWTPRLGAGLFQGDLGWWNTMKIWNTMKRVFKHVVTCCQLNMDSLRLEPLCGPCLVSRCNLSCKAPFTSGVSWFLFTSRLSGLQWSLTLIIPFFHLSLVKSTWIVANSQKFWFAAFRTAWWSEHSLHQRLASVQNLQAKIYETGT